MLCVNGCGTRPFRDAARSLGRDNERGGGEGGGGAGLWAGSQQSTSADPTGIGACLRCAQSEGTFQSPRESFNLRGRLVARPFSCPGKRCATCSRSERSGVSARKLRKRCGRILCSRASRSPCSVGSLSRPLAASGNWAESGQRLRSRAAFRLLVGAFREALV